MTEESGTEGQQDPGLWPVPLETALYTEAIKRPIVASSLVAALLAGLLSLHPAVDFLPAWVAFALVLFFRLSRPY